jgi:tRNA A37 N6-isopentenylltransferase MiaA
MIVPVICGTTSSGKSHAFELAKDYPHVSILSVDSRQFYKDLPVISGQDVAPPNATLYGQGILTADQVCNIADFQRYAAPIMEKTP